MRSHRSALVPAIPIAAALLAALGACSPDALTPSSSISPSITSPLASRGAEQEDDADDDRGGDIQRLKHVVVVYTASRVPALVISPLAKHGYVDHNRHDTTAILALIERRWDLAPLTARDAAANDMRNAFDFQQGLGEGRDR